MSLPTSTPKSPAAMLLDLRPSQEEANDEINDWLASGLQSYVEEGQRMCDAANGIPQAKRSAILRDTTHTTRRYKERQRSLSPELHPRSTSEPRLNDIGDAPPCVQTLLRNAQTERHIIINSEGHNVYVNCGTGQQNIYYAGSRDDRNNHQYDGHDENGYINDGNDDVYDYSDNQGSGHGYNQGYRQPERGRDDGDNGRHDDKYNGHTHGRDMSPYDCQQCRSDLRYDCESSYDEYSDW